MKKLLAFISFFLSVVVYSQSNNDRLRQTQYNNANSVQDLHSDSNAASDPAGNESSAITG